MRGAFRDYGLSIVLGGLFIVSWLAQTIGGWMEFAAEQAQHGEAAELFGDSGFIWTWIEATFENWQSEFLQLFTFVVLTTFLVHRLSHESRDSQDHMQRQVEAILHKVEALETKGKD
jgi:hypothetical protein